MKIDLSYVTNDDIQKVQSIIISGNAIASVQSVSSSGMSRRIKFYYIDESRLIDCTYVIAKITGWSFDYYKGLRVNGCGMDMVFHTLYSSLPYEKARKWHQNWQCI